MADSTPDHQSIDLSGIINLPLATQDQDGLVELADAAETQAGVDDTQAITPASAAATYLALAELTAKGDLLTATAPNTPIALPVGADGQILTACQASATGLSWGDLPEPIPAILCSAITDKGAILTGTAPDTPAALPVGDNGQVLIASSSAPTGLSWATPPTPVPAIPCSVISGKGAIVTGSSSETPVALSVGTNNQVLHANSACPSGLEWKNVQSGSRTVCALANAGTVAITMDNLRVCFNSSGNRTWAFSTVSGTSTAIAQVTTASDTALTTQRRVTNLNSATFCELGGNFVCAASCATYLICMGPLNNPNAIYCFVGMTGCNYCNNLFNLTRIF